MAERSPSMPLSGDRPSIQPDLEAESTNPDPQTLPAQQSSDHIYPAVHVSGQAYAHLGDNHYYNVAPSASAFEELSSTLFFKEILSRYDTIEDNYSETFGWIFKPPSNQQPAWDSFLEWLNVPSGIYWVSGKPGSGKSTLMKYLHDDLHSTRRTSNTYQVLLSFWFWEAANNALQRNFQGCLQSLLWQLLQDEVHGGEVAMALNDRGKLAWTTRRLNDALKVALKVLQDKGVSVLICLDGLDESGRDGEALCKFVKDIAKCFPYVKLCASSRPERLFEAHFTSCSKLKMQDLNESDIDSVINQDLLKSQEYVTLCQTDTEVKDMDFPRLMKEKAQGVLLWVRLAINDLLRGIQNCDTARELVGRVDRMPEGLDNLYDFMLRRNNSDAKQYRVDAAFYFQLISHRDMSIVEFSLAINDEPRATFLQFADYWEQLHQKINCERVRWTDPYPQLGHAMYRNEPFPTGKGALLDYDRLFARSGLWQWDNWERSLVNSELLSKYTHTMDFRAEDLMTRVIPHADPEYLLESDFGEEISLFHEIICEYHSWTAEGRALTDALGQKVWNFLCEATPNTLARVVTPTMAACDSLFLSHQSAQIRSHSAHIYILGSFDIGTLQRLFAYAKYQFPPGMSSHLQAGSQRSVPGPCVVMSWADGAWRPAIYAISHKDLDRLLRNLARSIEPEPLNIGVSLGIVSVRWANSDPRADVKALSALKTPLPSLHAALLHLGKPKDTIRRFAEQQENRWSIQLNEIVFRHWRAWF
ncbi:hypothetical protein OHC33_010762 [Knufia fluminis]|uniref:Nephrocystin 3-like N-terminal domain-containing protein n=1 Tax=Knufia fluminis TaxID=191047 RepID=A0AAN8I295_9EURO|nr:hypothetical protein OHC33_010762 [Knufia fluminis]